MTQQKTTVNFKADLGQEDINHYFHDSSCESCASKPIFGNPAETLPATPLHKRSTRNWNDFMESFIASVSQMIQDPQL